MRQRSHFSGFTLLEILLVVAAIAILAGIVIVAINPGKQLAEARNATRQTDVKTISDAVYQYSFDHGGAFPSGIDTDLRLLGTDASGCAIDCGNTGSASLVASSITDNSASSFNTGSYSSTFFNATNNWVQLTNGGSVGTYTSGVKDGGSANATWTNLSWSPQFPSGKELPNNGGSETVYASGNVDMSGNVLLMHLNETAGATSFVDSSGKGYNGTCSGTNCPTAYGTGRLNTGVAFDGVGDNISVPNQPNLNFTAGQDFTISLWLKTSSPNSFDYRQAFLGKGFSGSGPGYGLRGLGGGADNQIEFWSSPDISTTCYSCNFADDKWHHVVAVRVGTTKIIYFDGEEKRIRPASGSANLTNTGQIFIGYRGYQALSYQGSLDEIAIFNRALSATEVKNIYLRGATRLKLQVRSCSDATCDSASFAGPDGANNTFFSELSNATLTTPSFSLSNVTANRYFQYKTTFETDNTAYSPELKSVSIAGTASSQPANSGTAGPTLDACLDLTPLLTSEYLTAIPTDPKDGSVNKTYYALKKTVNGRVTVVACSAENDKSISATR